MKKNVLSLVLLAFVVFFASCEGKKTDDAKEVAEDQNEEKHEDDGLKKDSDKAVEIADGGMYEVQVANLALSKAKSADVKKFAQMMIDDHTAANNELKDWASKKGVSLPGTMSEDKQKKYDDLNGEIKDFDKEYMDDMVDDHQKDIGKFEKIASDANDAEFKSWASNKLPTLRHHLDEAKRIQDMIKK